jgi:hypothetical protein
VGWTIALATIALGGQVTLGAIQAPARPGAVPAESSHLRTDHSEQRRLIDDALTHCPTFQQLVDSLERSPVVVYVSFGVCRGRVAACSTYVATAAGVTYLQATLDPFDHSEAALVGLLAHELRHALELSGERVASREAFKAFYERHGRLGSAGYETDEAVAAGRRVEREFAAFRTRR